MKYYQQAVQALINMLHMEMRQHKGDPSKFHELLNLLEKALMLIEEMQNEKS